MIQLIATLKGCQGYAVLQNAISASVMPAGSAGASLLQSLAAYTTASNQQLTGVAVLAQCLLGASSSSWQSGRSFSSSSSSGSSTPDSSLRADLGSGSALGSMGVHQAESDTAKRRKSLLTKSGRFYETVNVAPYTSPDGSQQQQQHQEQAGGSSSGYQLLLRKYPIKTPAKNVLVLPTYSLALAVAAEWEWLPTGKPVPHLMPLTSLAATAIDQPKERSRVIEHLLKYVHTDGACIRYEPGPLEQRQQKVFDPLLQWAQQRLGWQLVTSHSIFGSTQPDTTVAAVQSWLQGERSCVMPSGACDYCNGACP